MPNKPTGVEVRYDISISDIPRFGGDFMESFIVRQAIRSHNEGKKLSLILSNQVSDYGWMVDIGGILGRDSQYSNYFWIKDLHNAKTKAIKEKKIAAEKKLKEGK